MTPTDSRICKCGHHELCHQGADVGCYDRDLLPEYKTDQCLNCGRPVVFVDGLWRHYGPSGHQRNCDFIFGKSAEPVSS